MKTTKSCTKSFCLLAGLLIATLPGISLQAQSPAHAKNKLFAKNPEMGYPNDIRPVGIIPDLSDSALLESQVGDDRGNIEEGDRVLLIIEDDVHFAELVLDLARERGFKGIVAVRGEAGLALARKFNPAAITLDLHLPDMDGWTVLDRLKHDSATRHIPIEVISVETERWRGLRLGAVDYIEKPVTREKLNDALSTISSFICPGSSMNFFFTACSNLSDLWIAVSAGSSNQSASICR